MKDVRKRRAGFTLIEATISISLLGVLLASLAAMTNTARQADRESSRMEELQLRARRALTRVTQELRAAGADTLVPNPDSEFGSDTLLFAAPAGFAGGAIQWGEPSRIALEYEPNEIDDGIDNDGDGAIDECQLVLTRNVGGAGERRVVLCSSVSERPDDEVLNGDDDNGNDVSDERGFNVHRVGEVLDLQITVESVAADRRIQRTVRASFRLRN